MNGFYEAVKGFTDLPIAVAAIIFSLLLKRKEKTDFAEFFSLVSLSATVGALVHIFNFGKTASDLIWVGLYLALFECLRRFSLIMSNYIGGKINAEKTAFYCAESVLYICAVSLMLFVGRFDMLCLLLFGLIGIVRIAAAVVKSRKMPVKIILILILAVLSFVFQALSKIIPYAVVYEHILFFAALFTVYLMSKENQPDVE